MVLVTLSPTRAGKSVVHSPGSYSAYPGGQDQPASETWPVSLLHTRAAEKSLL